MYPSLWQVCLRRHRFLICIKSPYTFRATLHTTKCVDLGISPSDLRRRTRKALWKGTHDCPLHWSSLGGVTPGGEAGKGLQVDAQCEQKQSAAVRTGMTCPGNSRLTTMPGQRQQRAVEQEAGKVRRIQAGHPGVVLTQRPGPVGKTMWIKALGTRAPLQAKGRRWREVWLAFWQQRICQEKADQLSNLLPACKQSKNVF